MSASLAYADSGVRALLVDAKSKKVLGALTDGATVDLSAVSGRMVRVKVAKNVAVSIDGRRVTNHRIKLVPGAHTMVVTRTGAGKKARKTRQTVNFTAIKSGSTSGTTAVTSSTGTSTPSGSTSSTAAPSTTAAGKPGVFGPLPMKDEWKANMVSFGRKYCDPAQIASLGTWEGNVWYYDGTRVYTQIGDYTKDASWYTCAKYVRDLYRNYLFSIPKMGGWRVFPHGLAEDYLRNNDEQSKEAVRRLAQESAFATQGGGADQGLSRETAYLINAYLKAEEVGFGRSPMLATAVNYALGHLDQWTVSKSAPYVKPFMMGLTFEALIGYHNRTGDARVLPAIEKAADWLWTNMWDNQLEGFPYILCRGPTDNPECSEDRSGQGADLSNLIVPAFGWLYNQTGDKKWIERGDIIFANGVKHAELINGKQFNQNYRWSFEYIRYRDGQ